MWKKNVSARERKRKIQYRETNKVVVASSKRTRPNGIGERNTTPKSGKLITEGNEKRLPMRWTEIKTQSVNVKGRGLKWLRWLCERARVCDASNGGFLFLFARPFTNITL